MWFIIFGILIILIFEIKVTIDDSKETRKMQERFLKRCLAEGLTIPKGTVIWVINEEQLWVYRYKITGYTFKHNDPRYEIRCLDKNSDYELIRFDSPYLFTDKNKAVEKLNSMRINKGRNKITENDII